MTLVIVPTVLLVGYVSYVYQSGRTANAFLERAAAAREAKNYRDEAMWLDRYNMMRPNDASAIVDRAIATDNAANSADDLARFRLSEDARRQLGYALSQMSTKDEQQDRAEEVRRRLIERLLMIGGGWYKEAERQVVKLDAPPDDEDALRWLAMSLVGQVKMDTYQPERNVDDVKDVSHWRWLAAQPYGDVLQLAVKANPDNAALSATFVDTFLNQPSSFGWSDRLVETEQPQDTLANAASAREMIFALPNPELQIADLIESLTRRVEDGHSQWIAYRYFQHAGDDDRARTILFGAADKAAERLEKQLPRDWNDADFESVQSSDGSGEGVDRNMQEKYAWDAMIVMEAAEALIKQDENNQASEFLRRLTSIDHTQLPADLVERAFLGYGHTWQLLGDPVKASEIWKTGVTQMEGEPLDLLRASTTTLVYDGKDLAEALAALQRFSSGIDRATIRLARSSEKDLKGTNRNILSHKVDVANWHETVLRGKYAERKNAFDTAVGLFQNALESSAKVPRQMRVQVATELANLHGKRGLWDMAGLAFDEAIALSPDDQQLRAAAARAWLRAGNRGKALRHRKEAETNASFRSLLGSAEAQLANQLKLLPAQRDLSGVRLLIRRATELLDNLAEQNPDQRKEILDEAWRHKVLVAYLPPEGVTLEEHIESETLAKTISDIAKSDPINSSLQAFAAIRLTAIGFEELGQEAIARMQSIEGVDLTTLAIVKASIAAIDDRFKEAAVILVTRSKEDKERKSSLLNQAADYAVRGNLTELAYRAIEAVPIEDRDVPLLRKLASLARGLPADSKVLTRNGRTLSPVELSTQWENVLRKAEGENGTYWRFARASTLIVQISDNPNDVSTNAARMEEVKKLQQQIMSFRRAWGPGIALGGWIAALENRAEEAINLLRQGIEGGDRRIQTRMLLVEQLNKRGRFEEAEAELQLAGQAVGAAPESMPQLAVELAQRQGDYRRSIAMARLSVERRKQDSAAHLLLAQALSMAASKAKSPAERGKHLAEARESLELASKYAQGDDYGVYASRLQFEFNHGDRKTQQKVFDAITESKLSKQERANLRAQAYMAWNDLPNAGKELELVARLSPSDTKAHMNLAKYYQMTGQGTQSINAIETAFRLQPNNDQIRNQLALALALQGGADIPWDRLNKLLGGTGGVDGTADSRLLHGLILAQRGEEKQQDQAAEMLQQLIDEGGNRSLEATRVLASLNRLRWSSHKDRDTSDEAQRWLDEAKGLYELLVRRRDPEPIDLYRYADLLLVADQPHDVQRLLVSLDAVDRAAVAALDIRLRYNQTLDEPESADGLIKKWAERASARGAIEPEQLNRVTGYSLMQAGFPDQAVPLLQLAYNKNKNNIALYVRSLLQAGQPERARSISMKHYQDHEDPVGATLMCESILSSADISSPMAADVESLLGDAMKRFPTNAALLESIGTIRLQQQNYVDAVRLFTLVVKIQPDRIRALNNLAMALSAIDGKAKLAIAPIDRAIEIAPANPELLDTKGVVLMKAGDLPGAKVVFEKAIQINDDPRFRFHLIMILKAMGLKEQARQHWDALDRQRLDPTALTHEERIELEEISKQFSGKTVS
tara:strand:+ start:50224 stop:54990 length:4767 start_codon:yes stop_codon:yes gene_type:complete